jgi:uncharacterized protein
MDWKEITIADKDLFDRFFSLRPPEASDYTFTNFFIWHFGREIAYAVTNDFLCIQVTVPGKDPHLLMPIGRGNLGGALETLVRDFVNRNLPFRMRAVTREGVGEIEQALPGRFSVTPEPDRFDYVYRVSELIVLEGSKFKQKRNHLNIFRQTYHSTYQPLTADLLAEVEQAEIEWCKKHDCQNREGLDTEKTGILQATRHFQQLRFQGGVLKVEGKIVAFTFGEALNPDTVVIHIEKADPDIHGAYQMINQQFLEHQWPNMTWVNREEDLGIEGLRKAKTAYNPVKMIEKFVLQKT